jgi:wyosine [tRNA(Phe)-imidazoG37] synthetase (radical SAM superfamily)
MNNKNVIESLCMLDFVVAKLDASNEKLFKEINQPAENISFKKIVESIKNFKNIYSGKLNIQTMFMYNNIKYAEEIANVVREIDPYKVQINTPLRPCSIKPLTKQQLAPIEKVFKAEGLNTISVYTSKKTKTSPLDKMELLKRRRSVL